MKWQPVAFSAVLVLLFTFAASAEFYQYRDKDGTIRYTDDATSIPEEQRPDVITHESVNSEPVEEAVEAEHAGWSEQAPETAPRADATWDDEAAEGQTEAGYQQPGAPETQAGAAAETEMPAGPKDNVDQSKDYDELNAMRESLRKTFVELEAEKKALGPPPPEGAKTGEKADYVQQRRDLERKIEIYNKQSEAFDEKVKSFNRAVIQ